MPLPLPNLDTRRWADLVDEARALIPLYAPRWTDHNLSDPGMTVIDLLAWIAEMDVYTLNRVPERHLRKFLELVGANPRGPEPAAATLRVEIGSQPSPPAPIVVPEGARLTATTKDGRVVPFRALHALNVVPAQVTSLAYLDGLSKRELFAELREGHTVLPLGDDPQPGATLLIGFDNPLPVGVEVRLGLVFAGGRSGSDERHRILDEIAARQEACKPALPSLACPSNDSTSNSQPSALGTQHLAFLQHHSVRLAWSFTTLSGKPRTLDPAKGEVKDDTRAFTLDGSVTLSLPEEMGLESSASPYYLGVTVASGDYDTAPSLAGIFLNALQAEQSTQEHESNIGESDGRPNQRFGLSRGQVVAGSLHLTTDEPAQGQGGGLAQRVKREWQQRPDFDASDGRAFHLVVDERRAEVIFSDGDYGRIPPDKSSLAATYLSTLASGGNLAPADVKKIEVAGIGGLTAFMPFGAQNGTERETVGQAAELVVSALREPSRAMTTGDYEYLGLRVPGTVVARAHALPGVHPSFPCLSAPGVVTVILVPDQRRAEPKPSGGLLDEVRRYLDRRRTLGTHVEVVGPRYKRVTVNARVKLLPGAVPTRVEADIRKALAAFLHPLNGGPAALPQAGRRAQTNALLRAGGRVPPANRPAPGITLLTTQQSPVGVGGDAVPASPPPEPGWPLGRDVYRSEVLQLLDSVAGVDSVLSLELSAEGQEAGCGNICVGALELAVSGRHLIEVEQA